MVRNPVFAGSFYPSDRTELLTMVNRFLNEGKSFKIPGVLKALVSPHAGYVYSGPIAGSAYHVLSQVANSFKRVLLLGPSHQVPFEGIALPKSTIFKTPLGELNVDVALRDIIENMPGVFELEEAHAHEHSLEVQLPFIQVTMGNVPILPLVVGYAEQHLSSDVIQKCIQAYPDTLIVISSDLSHFHSYEDAQQIDTETSKQMSHLDVMIHSEQACGCFPLNGLKYAAHEMNWELSTIDIRNSGDTSGDRNRVVGYGAFAAWSHQ